MLEVLETTSIAQFTREVLITPELKIVFKLVLEVLENYITNL